MSGKLRQVASSCWKSLRWEQGQNQESQDWGKTQGKLAILPPTFLGRESLFLSEHKLHPNSWLYHLSVCFSTELFKMSLFSALPAPHGKQVQVFQTSSEQEKKSNLLEFWTKKTPPVWCLIDVWSGVTCRHSTVDYLKLPKKIKTSQRAKQIWQVWSEKNIQARQNDWTCESHTCILHMEEEKKHLFQRCWNIA